VFTVLGNLSEKVFAEGKGVYHEIFNYTFTGGNAAGFDSGSIIQDGFFQIIPSTATKTFAEGQLVMREGDTALMNATGTVGGTPTPITGNVEISVAGQTTVRAQ
jgi:hypothetical protein